MKGRGSLGLVLWLTLLVVISNSASLMINSNLNSDSSVNNSSENDTLEIKVHRPGDSFEDDQEYIWSPNDLVENRVMQISVFADGIFGIDEIDLLNVKGYYNGEITDVLSFEINSTDYEANFTDNGVILTILYTYNTDIWGGNYSLIVNLDLIDGSKMSGSLEKLLFNEYDFQISTDNSSEFIYVCGCESKEITITMLNTGDSDNGFFVNFTIIERSSKEISIDEGENDFETTEIEVFGGESIDLNLILIPTEEFEEGRKLSIQPLYVEIYYENDEGELVYIHQEYYTISISPIEQIVSPLVSVTSSQFNYAENFYGNSQNLDEIETIFTLGRAWFNSTYEVVNSGYYSSNLTLLTNSNVIDLRIIYDNMNLTLSQFNQMNPQIGQNGQFSFEIYLNYDVTIIDFMLELSVVFDKYQMTNTSFKLSDSPLESKQIISILDNKISFEQNDQTKTFETIIETSSLSSLNYFENEWKLFCTSSDNIDIEIVDLFASCDDEGVSLPVDVDATYKLDISVSSWGLNNIESFEIGLLHNPSGISSSISQILTVSLELAETSDNDDQNDDTQNNNSQDNNTDNSSDNANNTIDPIDDNNQTNLEIDVDNDGVLDTSDNCLDTKPGEAVDEFGCTILEQDANDELQDNGNDQQEAEATSSKSEENNILLYVVLGLVIAAIVGGVLVIRSRKSSPQNNVMQSTSNDPIMPLPAIPMPTLEPVVLQQWTDGNGYSWRQMSDQSIMWWNGSEWIPYGKN